ncbi:MAG TPA: DUF1775 domain-containing protein [Gaiellaceae bacterium]|nr:DUF1775 domain-containing protein [Gaiellaceae bacterium]
MLRRTSLLALGAIAALAFAASASAHAIVSPAVALDKKLQVFTLSVPTEKEGKTTTTIELTLPSGFSIDSYEAAPGWTRATTTNTVTWSGGKVPTEEDAVFHFNASTSGAKTYTFDVRQTYSDGSIVDWAGPESSDTPAPTIKAVSSIGGSGTPTLSIVALIVGALGLVMGIVALASRGGRSLS